MYKLLLMYCVLYITCTIGGVTKVAYIAGRLQGCVKVKKEPTCFVGYLVPEYFARQQANSVKLIKTILSDSTKGECKETFRRLLCRQRFPRCIKSSNTIDFGNSSSTCGQLSKVCSKQFSAWVTRSKVCHTAQSGSFRYDKCVIMKPEETGNCTVKHQVVRCFV